MSTLGILMYECNASCALGQSVTGDKPGCCPCSKDELIKLIRPKDENASGEEYCLQYLVSVPVQRRARFLCLARSIGG